MPERADVVVIGGGCTGTSVALQLARRRAGRIVLLDRAGIAAGATGRSSALVRQHYTHETLARMALRALQTFEHFDEAIGGESGFRRTGFLVLVGGADVDSLRANVAMQQAVGIDTGLLRGDEVATIDARLNHGDVAAAAWEPRSGYADPVLTTSSYAAAARALGVEQRIGVDVRRLLAPNAAIAGIETSAGTIETRTVVLAAGYRSRELLAPLGFDLPLRPIRHAIAIVQRSAEFGPTHPIVSDRINGSYYRPEGQDLTLIGTTGPYEGQEDAQIELDRAPSSTEVETLTGRFCARFPSQDAAVLRRGYTGVYDCSPDLQPLLGHIPDVRGVYLAAGFSGHGFKLSPVVGEIVADQVVDGRSRLVDATLFSPDRFAANRPIVSRRAYSTATLG